MGAMRRLKRRKRIDNLKGDDCFCQLPDELIGCHILSRLTLEEAVRSSVLSRRWRMLWTYRLGPELSFSDDGRSLFYLDFYLRSVLRPMFVRWVDHVLELHSYPTIDEFIVRYDMNYAYSSYIDRWLEFAFVKGVKRLELDLFFYRGDSKKKFYVFPGIEKFSPSLPRSLSSNYVKQHGPVSGIYNLKDLVLNCVQIDEEKIESILVNCPFLERLSLWNSNVVSVKVCNQQLKLKSLEIADCFSLKNLEISAPNLISLWYCGPVIGLNFEGVPLLSDLCIGGEYCVSFLRSSGRNFGYISRLKSLKLEMSVGCVALSVLFTMDFPIFPKLEQLEVEMTAFDGLYLLWPTILIKAAPFLHRFVVTVDYNHSFRTTKKLQSRSRRKNIRNAAKQPHHNLKVVEFRGFAGYVYDLKLARQLLKIAKSVDKVIIDHLCPAPRPWMRRPWLDYEIYRERSRKRAQLLKKWLPPSAELIVL